MFVRTEPLLLALAHQKVGFRPKLSLHQLQNLTLQIFFKILDQKRKNTSNFETHLGLGDLRNYNLVIFLL